MRVLLAAAVLLGGGALMALAGFLYHGSVQVIDLGLGRVGALVWDGSLALAFSLQHSGMIRSSFRRRMEALLPRACFEALFAVASGTVLWVLLLLWQPVGPEVSLQGVWRWGPRIAYVLAVAGFAWAGRALDALDPLGIQCLVNRLRGRPQGAVPMVVRGPYRWVRHPMYLFALVLIWACPDLTPDRLLLNGLWTAWIVVATRLEERDLVSVFGEPYRRYRREVPMLVPRRFRPVREREVAP